MKGDDRTLLARLRRGPPPDARAALAELHARHAGAVLRFLGRLLDDPNDADDVLQDTFLSAARRADAFRGDDARSWLLAIAGNRARDVRRHAARRSRRERTASRPEAQPIEGDVGEVAGAMAGLGDRDRAVLELRFAQGLTHAQTAEVLGVSLRTAKSWTARALDALRARLEGDE